VKRRSRQRRDKMNKQKYIRIFLLSFLSFVTLACGQQRTKEVKRPNLLLISVDTLRADRLGCYGYERDTSPRIDQLAESGVLFENAFSSSPKTTPSHMSILTGLYPRVHNVYMWKMDPGGTFRGDTLSENIPTLAEILKDYGYANVAFTGGANVAGRMGFDRGFEIYDEDADTEAACRWLEENPGKRFFLFYHTYYTHDPYLPPPPYDTIYNPGYSGNIPSRKELMEETGVEEGEDWHGIWQVMHEKFWAGVDVADPADRLQLTALYDGAISYVDNELIRKLLETLEKTGNLDNTLIVLTSDHGEEFLEHGRLEHNSLHREVARVPLIMRFPAAVPEGIRIEELVRSVDILPTILDILAIPLTTAVQGTSLRPLLTGGEIPELSVYADFNDYLPPVIESIRSGPWFLLMDQRERVSEEIGQEEGSTFFSLYNTENDPDEAVDVSSRHPEIAEKLKKRLRTVRIESSRKHAEEAWDQQPGEMDIKNMERLKALGYL